jgi:hypothetical protein
VSVEAAIAAIPDGQDKVEAQIEWDDAVSFERLHPTLAMIAAAPGLTTAARLLCSGLQGRINRITVWVRRRGLSCVSARMSTGRLPLPFLVIGTAERQLFRIDTPGCAINLLWHDQLLQLHNNNPPAGLKVPSPDTR